MTPREIALKAANGFQPFEAFGSKEFSIRIVSIREMEEIRNAHAAKQDNARASAVARFLGDASGARVFSDGQLAEVATLPNHEAERILDAGFKLNSPKLDDAKKD